MSIFLALVARCAVLTTSAFASDSLLSWHAENVEICDELTSFVQQSRSGINELNRDDLLDSTHALTYDFGATCEKWSSFVGNNSSIVIMNDYVKTRRVKVVRGSRMDVEFEQSLATKVFEQSEAFAVEVVFAFNEEVYDDDGNDDRMMTVLTIADTDGIKKLESEEECSISNVRFLVRVRYSKDENAFIAETYTCAQKRFQSPMLRKINTLTATNDNNNESYLMTRLLVSFRANVMSGKLDVEMFANGESLGVGVDVRASAYPFSFAVYQNKPIVSFVRFGGCMFSGYLKRLAIYDGAMNATIARMIHDENTRMPEVRLVSVVENTTTSSGNNTINNNNNNNNDNVYIVNNGMAKVSMNVMDRDEIEDTFDIKFIENPEFGEVKMCSHSEQFCKSGMCEFCYFYTNDNNDDSMLSTAVTTSVEFVVIPAFRNFTYDNDASVSVSFQLLPTILACVEIDSSSSRNKDCLATTNAFVLEVTEDERSIINVCVNDTQRSSIDTVIDVDITEFPTRGAIYWQNSIDGVPKFSDQVLDATGRVFSCAKLTYAPESNFHGSDIMAIRISSRLKYSVSDDVLPTIHETSKQIVFNVINIEDTKNIVLVDEGGLIEIEWMSRIKLGGIFTIPNAGIDANAFLVRVTITSRLGNLVFLNNDTALDMVTSLPFLRGDGGGDSEIVFESTPDVANALLSSMEYLNAYGALDDSSTTAVVVDREKYLVDTVTVQIASSKEVVEFSNVSINIRIMPPSLQSYLSSNSNSKNTVDLKMIGILCAVGVIAVQILSLQSLKTKSVLTKNDDDVSIY